MNTAKTPNEKLAQLQAQLKNLKTVFEDLILNETEFEKLKPFRTQITALEKAIKDALREN